MAGQRPIPETPFIDIVYCSGRGVPIITTGCLKSRENGNPGIPIFTGCVYFHDTAGVPVNIAPHIHYRYSLVNNVPRPQEILYPIATSGCCIPYKIH